MKNRRIFSKMCIIFSLFLLINVSPGNLDQLMGASGDIHVEVTLKNGKVKQMEYSSFKINWTFPVVFWEDETCVKRTVKKEDIKDIYPISKSWNACAKEEDWLFEVDFRDGRYAQGYVVVESKVKVKDLTESEASVIKGISSSTGEEESIRYNDIKKISFVKK